MGKITATDRLIFTLLFSVIIHLAILLGVSFNVTSPPTNAPLNNLEITLIKQQTLTEPEEADYLAQVTNEGGGETEHKSPEPSPDLPVPVTEEASGQEAPQLVEQVKAEPAQSEPELINVEAEQPQQPVPPQPKKAQPEKAAKVITQAKSERKIEASENEQGDKIQPLVETPPAPKPKLSARELMMQARNEISALEKKLDETTKALSEKPKKRRISAATKEFAAAAYMRAWEMKVERIGNLNYPQDAKRLGINGSLMLSVDINPDGSVPPGGIVISRSSGYKVLDDAAVKIVRLGAPYAAIPKNVLKDNEMLTIIRTWKFETSRGLSTR